MCVRACVRRVCPRVCTLKRSTGRRKKSRKTKKAEKVPQRLLGPKTFPLDRLLAIFYSIVESWVDASSEIYAQIASLVTLRLIAQVTGADNLDAPRFKCMVGLQAVQRAEALHLGRRRCDQVRRERRGEHGEGASAKLGRRPRGIGGHIPAVVER